MRMIFINQFLKLILGKWQILSCGVDFITDSKARKYLSAGNSGCYIIK